MHRRPLIALPFITAAALTLLASCTVGPDYKRPPQTMPTTFKSATTQEAGAATQPTLARDWWKLFDDPTLDALEEQAIASNTDLKAAMARVAQARAAVRVAGSSYYPVVTLDPSIQRARTPIETNNHGALSAGNGGSTVTTTRIPFDLTYEVDVWGRIRRTVESAQAQAQASANDYEVVLQTIEADVAQDYFGIRSFIAQEEILSETVGSFQKQVDLTKTQLRAGLVGRTDEYQAETQLHSTLAQQVETHRQRVDLEHALAILLAKSPGEMEATMTALDLSPPAIPPGLPSELLRRRPDVAEAEQNLIAANAQVGVAQALFYPTISLTGSAGFESVGVMDAVNWQQRIWSIGASAAQPIFEGGRLNANLEQARARYDELQSTYRGAVLGAIRDVEDSLTDVHLRADEAATLARAVDSAREYLRLSQLQYRQGLIGYLQVIDAERTLLNSELTAAQILNQRLVSTVLLIKALGGGWEHDPAQAR